MNIKCNLIIDLNYILVKAVFVLAKSNMLYGSLATALENTVTNYKRWFPFSKIYLVSDSKDKSWRKLLYPEYKGNRKRDNEIDWEFVYGVYSEFKEQISKKGFKILETSGVEGDDWISYIVETTNLKGMSNIIVSNDYDIKQLLKFDTNDMYINLMTNEMFNKTKIFMPKNFEIFVNKMKKINNNDIFCLNNNTEFVSLIRNYVERNEIVEVNPIESLLVKMISGDTSDNIESVFVTYGKTGKPRGFGEKGAESIIKKYTEEFGDPLLDDPELVANIADLILEKRKADISFMDDIIKNLKLNKQLVNLELKNIPTEIVEKMKTLYNE
jgi:5'-3' exonuclease